jgi:hypothetical protein
MFGQFAAERSESCEKNLEHKYGNSSIGLFDKHRFTSAHGSGAVRQHNNMMSRQISSGVGGKR